ncbi:hypothetical protein Hdeb2414_s0004g00134151 [Helianthus debilis subsp. tardiflorus]
MFVKQHRRALGILFVDHKLCVMKNVRDIQGPVLAIVLERLKTHGAFP